jgi:hypothetical protein
MINPLIHKSFYIPPDTPMYRVQQLDTITDWEFFFSDSPVVYELRELLASARFTENNLSSGRFRTYTFYFNQAVVNLTAIVTAIKKFVLHNSGVEWLFFTLPPDADPWKILAVQPHLVERACDCSECQTPLLTLVKVPECLFSRRASIEAQRWYKIPS